MNSPDKALRSGLRTGAYYRLSVAEDADRDHMGLLAAEALSFMLACLQEEYPELKVKDDEGLSTFHGPGLVVRLANAVASGCFAVEVVDLRKRDHWDAFVLRLPDGSHRTGWSRLEAGGAAHSGEPHAWLEAVSHLRLGEEVRPLVAPEFTSLAVAMFSQTGVNVASWDAPEREALSADIDDLRRQVAEQSRQLRAIKQHLSSASRSADGATPVTNYERLDQIDDWALENADRIHILPRALSECRKSVYADPALLYQALNLLAITYRDVRLNLAPRESLAERARELGLDIGGSVEPVRATDDYFFRSKGRRVFLDQHLGRGNSRDQRHCLRIYYTWDDEDKIVIVGWMPSHLGNSMS